MKTYIAFLRGINVGGHRKIKMAGLKELLSASGLHRLETYIQSGNLVFQSEENDPSEIEQLISSSIRATYDFGVPSLVMNARTLRAVYEENPFHKSKLNVQLLHATFLAEAPSEERLQSFLKMDFTPEEVVYGNRVLYLHCTQGYGKTGFSNSFIEQKLKVAATTRNWKTVSKMLEMASELASKVS